ncbi:hypothetical protein MKW94_015961 [Papaver nudicaule]|uniref:Agenet domain-containing protein n=1 Tax=Papaver nudicaule TaxID=74823 RepID=A0AA41S8D3_PAPNU|nr:hypothetical protein [Papaver nudicaule]
MKVKGNLPFKVGQQVEAKSFDEGFRGAWFRCKIKGCSKKSKEPTVALDYLDYKDYKNYWTNLYEYQESPAEKHNDSKEKHLMLRPSYPQIYCQSQMPDMREVSETVGIVDGTWEVGDMVDWFNKGSYWSGRITQKLDDKNVEIQLPEPPMGEGETYKALCKDLRPSLDWTPKLGWTLPISEVGKGLRHCVRLIQPRSPAVQVENAFVSHTSAGSMNQELPAECSEKENLKNASVIKIKNSLSESPEPSSHSLRREILEKHSGNLLKKQKTDTSSINNDGAEKNSWSESVSSQQGDNCERSLAMKKGASSEDRPDSCGSSKKMRKTGTVSNSTSSDPIDSSILGLQELVNRVRWLKGVLDCKFDCSNTINPPWKSLENQASLADD